MELLPHLNHCIIWNSKITKKLTFFIVIKLKNVEPVLNLRLWIYLRGKIFLHKGVFNYLCFWDFFKTDQKKKVSHISNYGVEFACDILLDFFFGKAGARLIDHYWTMPLFVYLLITKYKIFTTAGATLWFYIWVLHFCSILIIQFLTGGQCWKY